MDDEPDRDFDRVMSAAASLGEHLDSVLIITTKVDKGETTIRTACRGNWQANLGSARSWIMRQETEAKAQIWRESNETQ